MAAQKDKLGKLHELVTTAYTTAIEADIEDEVFNPALLSAAAKFLKDNEITADIKSDDDLGSLRDKLRAAAEARTQAGQRILESVRTAEEG